jgi:hypothetical protein
MFSGTLTRSKRKTWMLGAAEGRNCSATADNPNEMATAAIDRATRNVNTSS